MNGKGIFLFGAWTVIAIGLCFWTIKTRDFTPTEYGRGKAVTFTTNSMLDLIVEGNDVTVSAVSSNSADTMTFGSFVAVPLWQGTNVQRIGPTPISPGMYRYRQGDFQTSPQADFRFTSSNGVAVSGTPVGLLAVWDAAAAFVAWLVFWLVVTLILGLSFQEGKAHRNRSQRQTPLLQPLSSERSDIVHTPHKTNTNPPAGGKFGESLQCGGQVLIPFDQRRSLW